LIGFTIVRLGVLVLPLGDLLGVHPHAAVLHPRGELVEPLGVVVLADAGAELEVPLVHTADQVPSLDGAVGQQRAAMEAAAVQDRDLVIVADDDQVHVLHEGVGGLAVLEGSPVSDSAFSHTCPQLQMAPGGSGRRCVSGYPMLQGDRRPGAGRLAEVRELRGELRGAST
jgi:hypothetical protein